MTPPLNRRNFLKSAGMATAAFTVARPWLNSSARTVSPNEKLNVAAIGFGGVGGSNVRNSAEENIVALCDLDLKRCASTIKLQPKAALFTDFREMLEKQKDIDAVIIATPDHSHAYIAMECMRAGKHVYVQKPIAHSVFEARTLTEAARKYKVVSQMGNQGHSGEGIRQTTEWIAAGLIGQVREVHAWTNRPIWPQSSEMERPKDVQSPPEGMDWNRWIGPAPARPFNSVYHPGKWRAWCDFGTGSLGDMGCHIIDPIFMALKLRYPTSVEGNVSTVYETFGHETKSKNECYPRSSIARFKFPAREGLVPVELTWWDGGLMPSRPDELEEGDSFGDHNGGCLFIGDKAKIVCGCYGEKPRILNADLRQEAKKLAKTIPRILGGSTGHEKDWIRACKGGEAASSNFDYSGPLSEMVLMGNLAIRYPDRKLLWDGEKMEVTNDKAANAYVRRQYREGFGLGA
ncbi:MAG: Gfo/Idh/MocA family oxidoreductase [Verrucomicrobiota bacterium]